MLEKPVFMQGLFYCEGRGLGFPTSFKPPVDYQVPADKRAQTIYFRAGNASDDLIYLILTADGRPMRYFPVGAKSSIHVPLAVVEDLGPGTKVEILGAARDGETVSIVLDAGFMEID